VCIINKSVLPAQFDMNWPYRCREKWMDKRDLSVEFRKRLAALVERSGLNQSAFATRAGLDRSALSQLLSGASTRLPRSETLAAIAAMNGVTIDWLLGLTAREGQTGEMRAALEIGEGADDPEQTLLTRWHEEAAGTKIRYVPATLPDQLKTPALIAFEARNAKRNAVSRQGEADLRLAWNRRADTDMEVCMPRQTLEQLAQGRDQFAGLSQAARRELDQMAMLLDELYPSFRLYLYDGRARFSAPYTVFGSSRAAVYMGGLYLVLNAVEPVRTLIRHFDGLVRGAEVEAAKVAGFVASLSP
jgi:transcriptional regulator with XRE-family HTH domain